ncbi:MAG: hypothetical protein RL112_41, partial [Planctomycetota bacterium]
MRRDGEARAEAKDDAVDGGRQAGELRRLVREGYAAIATADQAGGSCCGPQGGCGVRTDAETLARQIGYDAAEIAALPEGSNLGLSCGNPG